MLWVLIKLSLILLYIVWANRKGFGNTLLMCRLAWAFVFCLFTWADSVIYIRVIWVFLQCVVRCSFCLKVLPQLSHLCGLSPVWIISCRWRCDGEGNIFIHRKHVYNFFRRTWSMWWCCVCTGVPFFLFFLVDSSPAEWVTRNSF